MGMDKPLNPNHSADGKGQTVAPNGGSGQAAVGLAIAAAELLDDQANSRISARAAARRLAVSVRIGSRPWIQHAV